MPFPKFAPIRLSRRARPFDSPDYIYEIKFDGFRALAFIEDGLCRLVSRRNHVFRNFQELSRSIAEAFKTESAVLDGEIVCLDNSGRSVFTDLMFRRGECFFYAFDLLFVDGGDLRGLPLIERKTRLRKIIPRKRSRLLYLDHIEERGCELFESACRLDLEGIVAKRRDVCYRASEKPSPHWIKIKNPDYSQVAGRQEFFEERAFSKTAISR